ncbi:protein unc-50 homolog isoform X1 [Mangifera indica]|uniref:protein unc-50 homolog isoform X1 n=1 Tax=Mangifera indica TaxID=29780 RepID=UPI001CF95CEE|nr:protein unc-50 homolog isoform X1 [Mangifera indica]XP_044490083.1 protein unc-50 homolog isoform X1 [Mangifera indica]
MLPTSVSKERSSSAMSRSNSMLPQYLRRIIKWQQMDIEYTFWQMLHLCTSPKVVYQHTKYHKQTKNQWARDDPAFVVICSLLLSVATVAYCAVYDHSATHAVFVVISVLLFHFLITGAVLATCCWFLTNAYLREESPNSHVVEQRVEWLYAFDVHCNAFFPLFVMLHVIHYFLSPLLVAHGFIPVLLSNLLFMVAACYYHYLNFLGYGVLPFLERTTFFLYPIGVVIVLCPILILSGFNPSRYFLNMYFSQRL